MLTLTNIDASGFSDLALSFGLKKGKSNDQAFGNIKVEYKDVLNNGNWTELALPTTTFNTTWTLIQTSGSIPTTSNLSLRFTHSNATQRGIDDILLSGTAISSCTTPTFSFATPTNVSKLTTDAVPT